MYLGRTRENRVVLVKVSTRLIGQLVPLRFNRVTAGTLFGELVLEEVGLEKLKNEGLDKIWLFEPAPQLRPPSS